MSVTLPAVSEDRISTDLRELTAEIDARDPELTAHGILGGEHGYGADFDCDVFEMHPFWWGDCECGYESREWQWEESHPHADTCYQSELARREEAGGWGPDMVDALADEWGLSRFGSAVHCTCGRHEEWVAWVGANPHPADCPVVRPNFRHKSTGLEVRWYKYIGRGMEFNRHVSRAEWRRLFAECIAAVTLGGVVSYRGELLNRVEAGHLRPGMVIVVDGATYTVEAVTADRHRPVVHVHTVTVRGGRVVFERDRGVLVDVTRWAA